MVGSELKTIEYTLSDIIDPLFIFLSRTTLSDAEKDQESLNFPTGA